jgi:type IV secretory pathway VirD2 relaxase
MRASSLDRLLNIAQLAQSAINNDAFVADRSMQMMRPDRDRLVGKINGGRASRPGPPVQSPSLSSQADQRAAKRPGGNKSAGAKTFDSRQRAITKVHYFSHSGGGGGALKAHAHYIARDAAGRNDLSDELAHERSEAREAGRDHAAYLSRSEDGARPVFYDATSEGLEGADRIEGWARSDKRHFRVVLSAENGDRLHDLPSYTREVMARAEVALGTKLQWLAVDHHDTNNPHTHIVIRGRRAKGQDLVIPRDFIKYGFASIARDVATEALGPRSPADERKALDRDVLRHAPTRLDRLIAPQLDEHSQVRLAHLRAPNGDLDMTRALKARANQLKHMGLATEIKRNVLAFDSGWQDRLKAMELHLDIRKRLMMERTQMRTPTPTPPLSIERISRSPLGR